MKRRPVLILAIALACGGLSARMALGLMRQPDAPDPAPAAQRTRIAVAARDLPGGTVLSAEDVKMVEWPAEALPTGFIGSASAAVGQGLRTSVAANEPLLDGKLAGHGRGGLPSSIPEGMRAVSVRVDDVTAVAGFVVPGTRVDVLVTLPRLNDRPSVSRSILQNALVLASGQTIQAADDGKPQESTVITLLVTPEQTELLALASSEGRIQLALRNSFDQSLAITAGAHLGGLLGGFAAPPRPSAPAGAPRPSSPVIHPRGSAIEVYHGSSRTLARF